MLSREKAPRMGIAPNTAEAAGGGGGTNTDRAVDPNVSADLPDPVSGSRHTLRLHPLWRRLTTRGPLPDAAAGTSHEDLGSTFGSAGSTEASAAEEEDQCVYINPFSGLLSLEVGVMGDDKRTNNRLI